MTARSTLVLASLLVTVQLAGCSEHDIGVYTSPANPVLGDFEVSSDFRIYEEGPDAGFTIDVRVRNAGEAGLVRVQPTLSCDEGMWTRTQDLMMAAGETLDLDYFFREPTIYATCQGRVTILP